MGRLADEVAEMESERDELEGQVSSLERSEEHTSELQSH